MLDFTLCKDTKCFDKLGLAEKLRSALILWFMKWQMYLYTSNWKSCKS